MYRSLFRWSLVRHLRPECVLQTRELARAALHDRQAIRQISITYVCWKKRRSEEEKLAESHGRRVIRYSPKSGSEVVGIWRNMTVADLADVLSKDVDHILKALEFADKTDTRYTAESVIHEPRVVRDVVKICGCRFKVIAPPDTPEEEEQNRDAVPAPPAPPEALRPRPPVVCVMGHVDHGKTTLLDALRDASVVDDEFGGITQHIGAFEVTLPSGECVTFLDTPGHAAFSAMRARGAHATDIVVLVVAADDGVMEQTLEAIRMAREANVPILVAINKIDKPGVNIDKTLRSLAQHGIVCEAVGGDVQAVPISALKKQGLDTLIEALTLQAQLMELKADYGGYVEGVVIEAEIDPRMGKQATVLVRRGTLRRGCILVAGSGWARARALRDAAGGVRDEVPPAGAAAVSGWRALPQPGTLLLEVPSEKRANEVIRWRQAQRMKDKQVADLEVIEAKEAEHRAEYKAHLAKKRAMGRMRLRPEGPREKMFKEDTHPTLRVIVKGDVDGSVEAILDILETYDDSRVRLDVAHAAVGPVTASDVELAEAFSALIYAFNVPCPRTVAADAKSKRVEVRHHNVIYRLVAELKDELSRRLPPTQQEEILGQANVAQVFAVSEGRKKVPVAGARVTKGSLQRDQLYKVLRGGQVVYEGKLASMKHLKDEVSSIARGTECGLRLNDPKFEPQAGDTIQCYKMVDVAGTADWDPGF